jgi:D-alanyl-D-alanine endopeptidase (penicillin-binding protein 7)
LEIAVSALGKLFGFRWWAWLMVACMLATGPASAAAAAKKSESKRATATSVAKKPAGKRSTSVNRAVRVKASSRAKQRVRSAARAGANVRRASVVVPSRLSYGQVYGLHETADPLDLKSSVALVLDQETNEVLLSKNSQAVLPIASLTKLMTALVVIEAQQPLDEILTITAEDIDTEKGSSSRLALGTELTRGEMLHLALMSSENRAANALGRHFPGGLAAFVSAMNHKAVELGMQDTRYVEPTGLSSRNQSSARDLATLVKTAHHYPLIRELSTSPEYEVAVGKRHLQYRNTNGLVFNPTWEIGLQKTGYISEAGRCLVMQAQLAGRKLIMVFLDSTGRYSRIGDAERVRKWLEELSLAEEPEMPDTEVLPRVTS